ncbi:hypothetical protein BH23ACT2_BH23ACT2_11610 [soil metagenome]
MNPHSRHGAPLNVGTTATSEPTAEEAAAVAPPQPSTRSVSGRPADLLPGHRLVTILGGDLWMEAEAFVYEMYVSIGYTQPSPRRAVEELSRWSNRSRFHAVLDEDDRIIGTVRSIFGPYDELPVSQFERTDFTDPDPVCELSSLVVDPAVRSTGVIEHLYRAGWLDAWRSDSRALVALIDDWLFEVFRDTYCLPFSEIGPGRHYMGTNPVPVSLPLVGSHYLDHARRNPQFWAWILEGVAPVEVRDWDLPIVLLDEAGLDRSGVPPHPLVRVAG